MFYMSVSGFLTQTYLDTDDQTTKISLPQVSGGKRKIQDRVDMLQRHTVSPSISYHDWEL